MTSLTYADQLHVVRLAARAPSPHNIQPARWRFIDSPPFGELELHECTHRWLSVGDPTGRDNQIALGAAWEGMSIALSEKGLGLAQITMHDVSPVPPKSVTNRLIASAKIMGPVQIDSLAPFVEQRHSYRGVFPIASKEQQAGLEAFVGASDIALGITTTAAIAHIAGLYDSAAAHGMRDPLFVRELYGWMRFSMGDPNWQRDGLTTQCMHLSALEAWAAKLVLKPAVVKGLCALSLEGLLTAEAAKTKSAAMLVMLHAPGAELPFVTGRRFYRFWLELTRAGFCGVPMSALADSPAYAEQLLADFPLPSKQRLVNVMRIGVRPTQGVVQSARLPAEELLLP